MGVDAFSTHPQNRPVRALYAVLLVCGCSAHPDAASDIPTAPEATETPSEAPEPGSAEAEGTESSVLAAEVPSPWSVPCVEGCALRWPSAAGGAVQLGSLPCRQLLTEAACSSAAPGWLYVSVPACGESALYLEGCFWDGASCQAGAFWENTQACLP